MKFLDRFFKKQKEPEKTEQYTDPLAEVDIKFLDTLIDEVFEIDDHRASHLQIKEN
jgi:hypothetical protein